MQLISTQFAQMSEQAYRRAIVDLEAQRDLAIEDKDTSAIKKLDSEIDSVKEDHKKQVAAAKHVQDRKNQQEPTLEMQQWRKDNSWFDNDQEMQDEAVAIGVGYLAKNPNKTQVEMLKHVTDRIKKIYPEKFKSKKIVTKQTEVDMTDDDETDEQEDETVIVEKSKPNPKLGGNSKGKKLTVNDLNDQEKEIMKAFVKRGVFKKIAAKNKRSEQDEYLAQLSEGR